MSIINLHIQAENIEESFSRIAEDLLNHFILFSGEKTYRICEIEFYFTGIKHEDKYTHKHLLQKTSGRWYQHGSGLDITCGDKNHYGGILIRAIQELSQEEKGNNYIYGPLKCLQALMSGFKSIGKHEVAFGFEKSKSDTLPYEKVLKAPRAGLNPSRDPEMFNKLYRFFIFPKKKHEPKGEIIASLRGTIPDEELKLKEMFGWKTLPENK